MKWILMISFLLIGCKGYHTHETPTLTTLCKDNYRVCTRRNRKGRCIKREYKSNCFYIVKGVK